MFVYLFFLQLALNIVYIAVAVFIAGWIGKSNVSHNELHLRGNIYLLCGLTCLL